MANEKSEGVPTWFDDVHDGLNEVYRCAESIARLADAARELGNDRLADRLRDIEVRLFAVAPKVGSAVNESIDAGFKQARQTTATLLEGVLAGIVIGAREPKPSLPFVAEPLSDYEVRMCDGHRCELAECAERCVKDQTAKPKPPELPFVAEEPCTCPPGTTCANRAGEPK